MDDATVTAELRGLLRGALASAERARVMALDVQRPIAADTIVKAGYMLLAAIGKLEADLAESADAAIPVTEGQSA